MIDRQRLIRSGLVVGGVVVLAVLLGAWKFVSLQEQQAAAANQPEPTESVVASIAQEREHRPTTTSIGTVVALRSITLKNELPGTVRQVFLTPGQIVEPGTVLVALDVSVEEADLQAQKAQLALAEQQLQRTEQMVAKRAASQMELDAARAERDVALAQIARTRAIIERKTVRAPFRARVGISDVHPGQYLNEGTLLTTLQGVDDDAYVDFTVAQHVASTLRPGESVEIFTSQSSVPLEARILAIDSRVDPSTRNATVRAQIAGKSTARSDVADFAIPRPGASVRVRVPVGPAQFAVAVPAGALRKGPTGDHVFVIAADDQGQTRAHVRTVQAGPVVGDEVIIHEGLEPGERVAVSGSFKLREAVLVSVTEGTRVAATAQR